MYKTEKLTIDGKEITIKPLTGKYFAKFMKAASKMPQEGSTDIDEEAVASFHELGVVSLQEAYKELSKEEIEYVVTSNFSNVIKAVASVNTPKE